MKKSLTRARLVCLYAALSLLSGCTWLAKIRDGDTKPVHTTTTPPKPSPKTTGKAPDKPQPTAAAAATAAATPAVTQDPLDDGIELYNAGNYNGAIKRLAGAREIWGGDKTTQTTALKYMAFSYCVTGRGALCKQQFDKALKLDPGFDLAQGEKGHPLWGPVFDKAKKHK